MWVCRATSQKSPLLAWGIAKHPCSWRAVLQSCAEEANQAPSGRGCAWGEGVQVGFLEETDWEFALEGCVAVTWILDGV